MLPIWVNIHAIPAQECSSNHDHHLPQLRRSVPSVLTMLSSSLRTQRKQYAPSQALATAHPHRRPLTPKLTLSLDADSPQQSQIHLSRPPLLEVIRQPIVVGPIGLASYAFFPPTLATYVPAHRPSSTLANPPKHPRLPLIPRIRTPYSMFHARTTVRATTVR